LERVFLAIVILKCFVSFSLQLVVGEDRILFLKRYFSLLQRVVCAFLEENDQDCRPLRKAELERRENHSIKTALALQKM
ncbi:hypothetical protein CP8484711_0307B, partial [Chlamydia psittaci 84-8471/1]